MTRHPHYADDHRRPFITRAAFQDLVERAVSTFLHTMIAVWTAGNGTGLTDLSLIQAAAVAGLGAGLSTVQAFLGTRINGGDSGRILPKPPPPADADTTHLTG